MQQPIMQRPIASLDRADLDELRRLICQAIGAINSQSESSGTRRDKANDRLQDALDVLDALRESESAPSPTERTDND